MPSMRKSALTILSLSFLLGGFSLGGPLLGSLGQMPQPMSGQVQMILFKVVRSKDKKFLETPTGETIPIEGKHLARDATAVAVYRDNQNNYWFINKDGQPTAIPPEKVQAAIDTVAQQRMAKQQAAGAFAPGAGGTNSYPQPVQQTTIIQQPSSGTTGSSAMMMGTGLAAAGGAMAGSMIGAAINDGNHYYGIPYGQPLYRGEGDHPYYMNNGNKVYVNNQHTEPINQQWQHQGEWNNRSQWSNPTPATTPNSSSMANAQNKFNNSARRQEGHEGWGGFRGRRR